MDFEVIDFHTHPFINAQDNLCAYKETMQFDTNTIINDMKNAGVSKFCGSVIKKAQIINFDLIHQCNLEAVRLSELYDGMYIPGIQIHPDYIKESFDELNFAKQNNVNLVGELVPYLHNWSDYSNAQFSELLDMVEKYNMVVSVHTIEPAQMKIMAKCHKNVKFVFAHPGEKSRVLEHVDIMQACDNVYLDISGTGNIRYGMLKYLVNKVGADRILFGSDYPIGNPLLYISGVIAEKISDDDKEKILCKNAKKLLSIK